MSNETTSNPKKRIVITGGSGVVGRCVVQKLLSYGHEILNVDQTPLDNPNVHTLKADLTDGAQAFNALSCHFQISEPFLEEMKTPDVVIHLAGTYLVILSDIATILEEKETPGEQKLIKISHSNYHSFTYIHMIFQLTYTQASHNQIASLTMKPSVSTPSAPTP
jgi:nucleoside-diphosphate-sugar epimerase